MKLYDGGISIFLLGSLAVGIVSGGVALYDWATATPEPTCIKWAIEQVSPDMQHRYCVQYSNQVGGAS